MSFTLRSTSNSSIDNERLTRARQAAATAAAAETTTTTTTTLNRFLSFNENQSSSAENRRRLLHSTPNLIELLEDEDDDTDDNQALCHECDTCSKVFASEYGLNHHTNMHHPNQSILCALCNITFRSHRSLKTHKQRRHSTMRTKLTVNQPSTPNYSYISSYLVLPFSSKQFPQMARRACEQQRLPLGSFSSKLYQCHFCSISFPCSRTLSSHLLDQHEQYEYKTCQEILSDLTIQIEYDLRTVHDNNDDEVETTKLYLAKQAPYFGLINKQLDKKYQETKAIQQQQIYPRCPHTSRTCANLCLQYLSSYSKLIQNYSYAIPIIPKGNPFAQGSILSSMNSASYSNGSSSLSGNDSNQTNELGNGRQKRKSGKQMDASPSSPQLKRKSIGNSKTKITVGKQPAESATKTNETKYVAVDHTTNSATLSASTYITKRIFPKNDYNRSSSISSNSSTSTRSSTTLAQQTSIPSPRMSKRRLSPPVVISLDKSSQKRRRSREQQLLSSKSEAKVIRIDGDDDDDDNENDLEQENGEDKGNDSNDDVIPITFEKSSKQGSNKHRQASSGSVEYVQMLDDDQQSTASLNNIENIKSKGKVNDEEIIICRSPPTARKMIPPSNTAHSKTTVNGHSAKKSNRQQSSPNDEHVRVRCKICGDILEGRSRFSKHVIAMHSHLLDKNMSNPKQQQQQTAIVR